MLLRLDASIAGCLLAEGQEFAHLVAERSEQSVTWRRQFWQRLGSKDGSALQSVNNTSRAFRGAARRLGTPCAFRPRVENLELAPFVSRIETLASPAFDDGVLSRATKKTKGATCLGARRWRARRGGARNP
jgi:hypothetical protein